MDSSATGGGVPAPVALLPGQGNTSLGRRAGRMTWAA